VLVAANLLAACFVASPDLPVSATVSVDAGKTVGMLRARFDTQIVYPAVLDEDMPSAAEYLKAYAADRGAPLRVRLLLSTDGAYVTADRRHKPTLPTGWSRTDWDFTPLDLLVEDVFRAGAEPVIDIGYMPDWMWNCATGEPSDPTFITFGEYAARLVSYYNRGAFATEDGRSVINPAGASHRVTTWELWNEPNFQTLSCLGHGGAPATNVPAITPAQYLAMWNATAPRMLAVDPTIRLAGPATTAGVTGRRPDYVEMLMGSAAIRPDVVTFHAYGSYNADETDGCLLDNAPPPGRSCFAGGIPAIAEGVRAVRKWAPAQETWLTELNVLASYGNDPKARNWNALGASWQASAFVRLGEAGVSSLFAYSFVHPGGNQFSVLDWTKGATYGTPLLSYWTAFYISRFFPPGSAVLSTSSKLRGVDTLAVRTADGGVSVLVVNRQVASSSDVGGVGVPRLVSLSLPDGWAGSSATLWQLDRATGLPEGPAPVDLPNSTALAVRFNGYGVAIFRLE